MQIGLTAEQHELRRDIREFAETEIKPVAQEYNELEKYPADLIAKAADKGILGETIPEEYGGTDLDYLSQCIVSEELARIDFGICIAITGTNSAALLIGDKGSEAQKEKYLPPVASGESTTAIAITEQNAGSDVSGIETTARRDGDEYVINGEKKWITNAGKADFIVVFARTSEPSDDRRYAGISAFILVTDQEGYSTTPTELMGMGAPNNVVLTMNDVRTPVENRIGEEDTAFYDLMEWFNKNRVRHVASYSVGLAQGAFEQAIEYATDREQFNRRVSDFQGMQWKFADMATEIETARWLNYRAASLLDEGIISPKICSMAKLNASQTATDVVDEALQVHGGIGYSKEKDIERFYRDAKLTEIFEGTKEVLRNVVGKEIVDDRGLDEYMEY